MIDNNFPNYFDLGANEVSQFVDGPTLFQNMSHYQQGFYNQGSINNPPEVLQSEATQSPSTTNGFFSPANYVSDGSMNGMSTYGTPAMEESNIDPDYAQSSNTQSCNTNQRQQYRPSLISRGQQLDIGIRAPTTMSYSDVLALAPSHSSPLSSHRSSPAPQQMMGFVQAGNTALYDPNPFSTYALQPFPHLSNVTTAQSVAGSSTVPGIACRISMSHVNL